MQSKSMNFGEAVEALKKGLWVQREGWNGKGMHLYLENHMSWTAPAGVFEGEARKYEPVIVMFTAQKKHQPGWLASQADILAEDWQTVEFY